jgi:hypothetical protein
MEEKKAKMREERLRKKALAAEDIVRLIKYGNITEARQNLIFYTDPSIFTVSCHSILGIK